MMRATRLPISALLVAVLLAACSGTTTTPTASPTGTPSTSTSGSPSADGSTSPEPTASDIPTDTPEPSATPSDQPTESPTGSSSPSVAAACSGTNANRDFYASVAAAVQWPLYCPVLPAGWFVESGQYRLAGGGRMEISYRGPSGRRLELHEGAFCSAADGCVPSGTDVGAANFGDRPATLVSTDAGGWAIVVDRGSNPSWLAVGSGLDEATFRDFGTKFTLVNR